MFKAVTSKSSKEYFDSLPSDRSKILRFLDKFIKDSAPSLKSHFAYNMPGYGNFKYNNYKGETIDWPTIAVASQKNYVSIYVCAMESGEYIVEKYRKELGKVSVGRSCIRFKKIEDLNLEMLKKIIKLAEKNPGLVGLEAKSKQ